MNNSKLQYIINNKDLDNCILLLIKQINFNSSNLTNEDIAILIKLIENNDKIKILQFIKYLKFIDKFQNIL